MNLSITKDGYVYCLGSSLHRHVMGVTFDGNIAIDHINRDKLDNRKENLRICTAKENAANTDKPYKIRKHSRHDGVSKVTDKKLKKMWTASIKIDQKESFYLGYWETEKDAALAHDKAVRMYLSNTGRKQNFPGETFDRQVPNVDYFPKGRKKPFRL